MGVINLFAVRTMPLKRKLLIAMFVPALLIGTIGVLSIASLRHLEKAAGLILSENYHSIQEARKMEQILRTLESIWLGKKTDNQDTHHVKELLHQFDQALAKCEKNITERGESAIINKLHEEWKKQRLYLLNGHSGFSAEKLQEMYQENMLLFQDLDRLIELNEVAMFSYEHQTRKVAHFMVLGVSGAFIIALFALAALAILSANKISKPISMVARQLHRALNPPEEDVEPAFVESVDEIEQLRHELEDLLKRLAHYEDEQSRKLSHLQESLAVVVNEVLEGLALLDDNYRILTVNRVAKAILNVTNGEGSILSHANRHPDVAAICKVITNGAFLPERDLGEFQFEIDGQSRVYRPRILTISSSEDDGIEGYLLLFWDITEQRRFEESRRRFISMLSHQLKTPMTSLSMSLNLLKEKLDVTSPRITELMGIATENCSSLSNLISELIEASRETTPDLTLTLRRVNLGELLRTALYPLKPQAEEKNIELALPKQDSDLFARVDPVKFPWVVTNLVGNALRYTPSEGLIAISIEKRLDTIVVEVADSGSGIPEKDLRYIFEPYVSLDAKPKSGTHGLGLAIVKEIVQAHNGTIQAKSEVGKGTSFSIEIPL